MSFFGIGQQGITLKELLENPKLQTAPNINDGSYKKDKTGNAMFDPTSAFLGPNLWNNNAIQDDNFQLEYMDLDEFLSENGIPADLNENSFGGEPDQSQQSTSLIGSQPSSPIATANPMMSAPKSPPVEPTNALFSSDPESPKPLSSPSIRSLLTIDHITPKDDEAIPHSPIGSVGSASPVHVNIEFDVDESDIALASIPGHDFDPKKRRFTTEELKPQPIIKKSRKIFVPDDCKDDKYWNRRKKNNVAAKRSRDARRIKENQIAMRASFLEKENETLKKELEKMKKDNIKLRTSLSRYESCELD